MESQTFEYSGYNGKIGVSEIDPNIQIIDSETGEGVTSLEPNHSYYLQAETLNTGNKIQNFDMDYEKVAESHFLSPVDLNAPSSEAGNKYQNMVDLATKTLVLPINYVFTSSSSSSENSSSSEVTSSSTIVASSSIESNSSLKSSSSSSSIKSSVKSSSLKSSSSSKKSSSSSIKSSAKSSSLKSSSSSKKSLAVSSSKASSKVTSSSKKAIVTGVHHNSESGKGSGYGEGHGQGKGYGHGIPQTGEAAATALVVAGVVLLATAGAITLRKRS